MRQPRPYQTAAVEAVRAAYKRGLKGVAIEQATGTGKGYEIAAIAKDALAKGNRVLVLVNRDNLVTQLKAQLIEQGLLPQVERAMDKASVMSDLVVGSIPTLQGDRLLRWNRNHFKLVITDEAHFAASETFKNTLEYFRSSYHLFMSATIERHDKAGLWDGVEEVVFQYPLRQAIDDGWLVDYVVEELPVPINLSDKQAAKKMWTEKDEMNVFSTNEYLPRLFAESAARSHGKHGCLFWPSCDASKEAAAHFKAAGIDAKHVDGYMKESEIEEFYEWFKTPGPKCGMNADLLSYGYDNPLIDLVGLMRIQRSIPMMKQRIGRATRCLCPVDLYDTAEARKAAIAASTKPIFTILDLMIQVGDVAHTFADPTALISADPEEREFIRQENRKAGKPLTQEEIAGKLKAKRQTDKDAQLAKLAEDAANAAEKRRIQGEQKPVFIGDILKRYNPNHKPASDKFVWFVRGLAKKHGAEHLLER